MTYFRSFIHPRVWKIVGSGFVSSYLTYTTVYNNAQFSSSSSSTSSNSKNHTTNTSLDGPISFLPSVNTPTTSASTPSNGTVSAPSSFKSFPAWVQLTKPIDPQFLNSPTVSSCFVLLYYIPSIHTIPADENRHYHVSPLHLQQGFGIRFATGTRLAEELQYYQQQQKEKTTIDSSDTAQKREVEKRLTTQNDPSLPDPLQHYSHYKLRSLLAPRVCLVLTWRGGLEIPGGKRDKISTVQSSSSSSSRPTSVTSSSTSTKNFILEPTLLTANRELLEETGVSLYDPQIPRYDRDTQNSPIAPNVFQIGKLTYDDAVAYLPIDDDTAENLQKPRWLLFAKRIENKDIFQRIVSCAPNYARDFNQETMGTGAIQTTITYAGDRSNPGDRIYGIPRILAMNMQTFQSEMLLAGLEAIQVFTKKDVQEVVYLANAFQNTGGLAREGEELKGKGLHLQIRGTVLQQRSVVNE